MGWTLERNTEGGAGSQKEAGDDEYKSIIDRPLEASRQAASHRLMYMLTLLSLAYKLTRF